MVRDPALIVWLDGQKNTRKAPNENLARELMELFTLGIGALHRGRREGRRAGADRLGGRPAHRRGPVRGPAARPRREDASSGRAAAFDAEAYAGLLAAQPAAATFVAGRLWFRYAGTDAPAPARPGRRGHHRDPARDLLRTGLRADPGHAGEAAGGVAGRRAAAARHPTVRAARAATQATAGRPERAGPGAAAPAERRRLAGRRRLADHLVVAGPAADWPGCSPPPRHRRCWPG